MKIISFYILISALFLFQGCKKERSFERSRGTLQSEITGNCLPKTIAGTYEAGKPITNGSTHYMEVQVDVTKTGVYNITSDTVNGISFAASGNFRSTGLITVRLPASGTPVVPGVHTFTVTYNNTQCFVDVITPPITSSGGSTFTLNCTSAKVNGEYKSRKVLTSTNTVRIDVNVATPGTYSITTFATNGMTFTASGNFTTGGITETVELKATGTPIAPGTFNIKVIGSSCSFDVVVTSGASTATIDWRFTENGHVFEGSSIEAKLDVLSQANPVFTALGYSGTNNAGDYFVITIADISGAGIIQDQIYLSYSLTNFASFSFESPGKGIHYEATPAFPEVSLKFTITSHTAKTITGTFSGTVWDVNNKLVKTISGGTFKVTYP